MTNLSKTDKNKFFAVEFRVGAAGSPVRKINWDENETVAGDTYFAAPHFEFHDFIRTGVLDEAPAKIIGPYTDSFLLSIASGDPLPKIYLTVRSVTKVDSTIESEIIFIGTVNRIRKNPDNNNSIIELQCKNRKSSWDIPMGFTANAECPWYLGGPGCLVDKSPYTQSVTIATVNNREVTLGGFTPDVFEKRYLRGFIKVGDLKLMILKHEIVTDVFSLVRYPPSDWLSASAVLEPGCDKQVSTCRSGYNNEAQFGGSGFAMPAHNPILES